MLEFNQNSAESDSTTSGIQSANTSTFELGNEPTYNDSGDTFIFYAFYEVQDFPNLDIGVVTVARQTFLLHRI